jgi:hypothetical protein
MLALVLTLIEQPGPDPYHILQNCPLIEVQHQQTWPEDLDTQTRGQRLTSHQQIEEFDDVIKR